MSEAREIETIDISATPAILIASHNRPLGWNKALGELVDNSFDADASRVVIDTSK